MRIAAHHNAPVATAGLRLVPSDLVDGHRRRQHAPPAKSKIYIQLNLDESMSSRDWSAYSDDHSAVWIFVIIFYFFQRHNPYFCV